MEKIDYEKKYNRVNKTACFQAKCLRKQTTDIISLVKKLRITTAALTEIALLKEDPKYSKDIAILALKEIKGE